MGRTVATPSSRRTIISGEAPIRLKSSLKRRKNMYGEGFNARSAR